MTTSRKLTAALAVRLSSTRLFGKPLQNLDVKANKTILQHLVECVRSIECVDEIVLGIADGPGNEIYEGIARSLGIMTIYGPQDDVLARLIACGEAAGATDVLRLSSESPFLYFEALESAWKMYCESGHGALFLDNIIDGCGFEILSLEALRRSHEEATREEHFEHCSMYIRENHEIFGAVQITGPAHLDRRDLRLTVDTPEDLFICRHIFAALKHTSPRIALDDIVKFLDQNPHLISLTAPLTEPGYRSMFVWGYGDHT